MIGQSYYDKVNELCDKLRQRRIIGSYAAAKGTADLLRQLASSSKAQSAQMLLDEVRSVGVRIQSARPIELVIGNVVRRVMHIIREEMEDQEDDVAQIGSLTADSATPPRVGGLSRALNKQVSSSRWSRSFSLHNLLDQEDFEEPSTGLSRPGMQGHKSRPAEANTPETNHPMLDIPENEDDFAEQRQAIVEGIDEFIEELKDTDATIATHAPEHIHANEVILTFGYSYTVLQFLKRAKEKRNFQVIVSEGAPLLQGYKMANNLESLGIRTTVIADASCYAIMSRVNKVLISAHALLADGGVMAPVGTSMVAAAAKRYMVPVVVLAGIYKLSPNFPHEPGVTFNDFGEPSEVLPFSHESVFAAERAEANCGITEDVLSSKNQKPFLQVHNPSYDYVAPDRISLFLTDHGHGFMPSYVYRQLSEFYNRQDYQLSKQLDAALSR